ncbi:hypothetical protein ACIQXI_01805 [Lysinibacillus sp. NPDC097195]|uniref:AbiTii domain-containing protein n=1 Tax=Lysinibacillus sp. NPDC097195 TaxID=3364141 RepID=UPI00382FF6B9
MARSNLLKDVVSNSVSLENILLRLKIILSDLEDGSILEWIDGEVSGYKEYDSVPQYRIIEGRAKGTFLVNQSAKYTNALVPLNFTRLPGEYIQEMLTLNVRDGISTIEKNLISENRDQLGRPIPTELCHSISTPQLQIVAMDVMYAANDFESIITYVKNKVVDIILTLEKNFSTEAIDTLDISETIDKSPNIKPELVSVIHNLVYNDRSVEIGDNNKVSRSKIGSFFKGK